MPFNPNLPYSQVHGASGPAVFEQGGVFYERDGTQVPAPVDESVFPVMGKTNPLTRRSGKLQVGDVSMPFGRDRRGLLIVGNSIAGQSGRTLPSSTTTITASEVRPGSTSITLVPGGVAALGLVTNDYITIGLCSQQPWLVKVTGITGEVLTLDKPLPRLLRASAGVSKSTSPHYSPLTYRNLTGIFTAVNQMLGAPLELLPVHGHGSASAAEIVEALPALVAYYRPAVVALHLYENDVSASTSISELIMHTDNAVRLCLNYGAVPVVASSLPTNSLITAARAQVYDDIESYVLALDAKFPGAVGVNPGALYIDKTNPSYPRQPLSGWTDGVHPVASKRGTIAASILEQLRPVFGSSKLTSGIVGPNPRLNGSGGTGSGLAGGSVIPASTTVTAQAGVTCAASKTASDALYLDGVIAGASNISTTVTTISQTFAHPKTWGPNTFVKAVARLYIEELSNVSMITLTNAQGAYSQTNQDQDIHLDPAWIGKEILIETPAVPYRDPATTSCVATLAIRPSTSSSPSGVVFKVEVRELGWEVVPQAEMPLI